MNWAEMLQQMNDALSEDDLRTLCFELSLDFENLSGDTKKGKARELIAEMQRQRRVDELVERLRAVRPHIGWQRPSPQQQANLETHLPGKNSGRRRPAGCGDSISHYRGGAATFCCLMIDPGQPGHVYLLLEQSGIAWSGNNLRAGDPIIQPGKSDGGSLSQDVLATVSRWGTIKDDPLAAAENIPAVIAQIQRLPDVSAQIGDRGFLKGVRQAEVDTAVFGSGRTSGEVQGTIRQVDATIELMWPAAQVADLSRSGDETGLVPILFAGLIRTTPMMQAGDGGMLLLDGDNYALGIGFAGNDAESYFLPMDKVMAALGVEVVTEAIWQALANPTDEAAETELPDEGKDTAVNIAHGMQAPITLKDLAAVQNQLEDLRRQLQRNRLVLFVGADFPQGITGLPSRAEMAAALAAREGLAPGQRLTAVAQSVMAGGNRWEFTDFLRQATETVGKQPQAIHRALVSLVTTFGIATIITTAYDDMLEFAFRQAGQSLDIVVREADLAFVNPDGPVLIRLYGHGRQPDTLVVTEQDHMALLRGRSKAELVAEVQHALRRHTVLYVGHDLSDPTVAAFMDELSHERSPRSYAVWAGLPQTEQEFFRSQRNVEVLEVDALLLLQALLDK